MKITRTLLLIAAIALSVAACKEKSSDTEDPVEYLSFRIEGATDPVSEVQVFTSGTVITSYAEHIQALAAEQCVAAAYILESHGNSADLQVWPVTSASAQYWKGSGSYVTLVIAGKKIGVADVTFKNGGATVKYSSFKPGYTLP